MSQVKEIHDLTDSEEGQQIMKSLNRLNYKQGSSAFIETDHILRIPTPAKRRQIEYPNFDRQYIQNINIPSTAKTEGDNDQNLSQDDNYHFLMSLLPYLREVPKNRKMAIRHKLQSVFVEEQERKSGGRNINVNHSNLNNVHTPFANMSMVNPMNQQTPRLPPPPYPYKQNVFHNYVPSASVQPMPKATPSTSTLLGNLIVQQQPIFPEHPVSVGLPSEHQQSYNAKANNHANNNGSFGSNAPAMHNNNNNNANNNNYYFGYNATAMHNNNANKNANNANNNNNINNNNINANNNANNNNAINNANNNNAINNANNNDPYVGYNATTTLDNNNSLYYL
ncbi:unnamed protein product [Macrosiphum euphorbiae]|uniref:BESS domain-containing protein n=1 Tax=Macrosiphum euphorbiae TaxID=13131 RepID=A0AAV0WNC4_9HEMI|nr:unnamed protein product [Macrosiphum euphorbiae]